jgi:hypothetical protein
MVTLRFIALAFLAAATPGATRPNPLADLADRARSQPAELAADALLRIAAAPEPADAPPTDIAWRRQLIEDAFHLAAGAQQPFARRNWTGKSAGLFDKSYVQGLDACTLQCRAVHAMLELDYKKARELFLAIPAPRIAPASCNDTLIYDPSVFYATADEIAARAFSPKEVANEEPFHLLERYAAGLTSIVEAAPIARMLTGAPLKNGQFETLTDSFAAALEQLSRDESTAEPKNAIASDAAAIDALAAECTRRGIGTQALVEAWRAYGSRNSKAAPCADAKPVAGHSVAGQCESSTCRQLAAQFSALTMGTNGFALTAEQKSSADWDGKLRQYLAALADWKDADDPSELFQFKSRFYSELFHTAPNDVDRDLLLGALLNWLQQNGYQREHRVEWFYAVNTLIIRVFSDPRAMKTTVRALRDSADPVISFYAQLEQLLPRPMERTFELL